MKEERFYTGCWSFAAPARVSIRLLPTTGCSAGVSFSPSSFPGAGLPPRAGSVVAAAEPPLVPLADLGGLADFLAGCRLVEDRRDLAKPICRRQHVAGDAERQQDQVLHHALLSEVFRVDLREMLPLVRQVLDREDRVGRADGDARAAVDALVRVDVKLGHLVEVLRPL